MFKLAGLFSSFDNLDQISAESVASWLKNPPPPKQLENYLANRILYPGTLPLTASDMQTDLAILREALKMNKAPAGQRNNALLGDNPFLNTTLRKILIPAPFLDFVPDLVSLTWVFIDALLADRKKQDFFQDLWTIVLTDDTDETVGSLLLPQFKGGRGAVNLKLFDKNYRIQPGSLVVIPCAKDRCEIAYKIQGGMILGKAENSVEVCGGKLGLVVDGRSR